MTARVVRWSGGPGAGKTRQLLTYCEREADQGATVHDLAVMSFSRAQTADLADRLRAVFPGEMTRVIRARCTTIHSAALSACRDAGIIGDPRTQVITPDSRGAVHYREFAEAEGLPYDPAVGANEDEIPRSALPLGNQIVGLDAYLTATLRKPGEWRPAAQALGFSIPAGGWPVADLISRWRAFKERRDLFEHEDYIARALRERLPPPAPVLMVDEFQDVSRAQGELIRQWVGSGEVDRVYVAGDPDQSIYSFRGCDPTVFTSLPAVDEGASADRSRPVSFRCPETVMAAAEEILGSPARVDPCGRPGVVRHVAPPNSGMLAAQVEEAVRYAREFAPGRQPVFVLTRFRRNVRSLARDLGRKGIPCTGIRRGRVNLWTAVRVGRSGHGLEPVAISPWALVQALVRYVGGSDIDTAPLPKEVARALVAAVLSGEDRSRALAEMNGMSRITAGTLYHWTGGNLGTGIYARLNLRPWVVANIRAALDRQAQRGYVIAPEEVRVDTIHASKGLEAAVVLLHTGYLRSRLAGFPDAAAIAEERRIFYVGATRASHALIVVDYGTGPTSPILSGVGM